MPMLTFLKKNYIRLMLKLQYVNIYFNHLFIVLNETKFNNLNINQL